MSKRADLSKLPDLRVDESDHIEPWGGTVLLKEMDAFERLDLLNSFPQLKGKESATIDGKAGLRFTALLVSKTVIDDDGNRPLDSAVGRRQVASLALADPDAFAALSQLAIDVNHMGQQKKRKRRPARNGRSTSRGKSGTPTPSNGSAN